MSKFGFYDPASIRQVDNGILAINFINAQNANDVETIRMNKAEDVDSVIRGLDDQTKFSMATLGGEPMSKLAGAIRMSQDNPGHGVMTEANSGKIVPVRLAFGVEQGDLPEHGICMAVGAMRDGSFDVFKMAVKPIEPALVAEPEEEPHP